MTSLTLGPFFMIISLFLFGGCNDDPQVDCCFLLTLVIHDCIRILINFLPLFDHRFLKKMNFLTVF